MLGLKERMFWKYFFVFVCCAVYGIYCENVWNDDDVENYPTMLEGRTLNGHYRHSIKTNVETSKQHHRHVLSDEPMHTETPFMAVDRKYVRRTNFRRRKMGSSNNKKNIFRRGQRHRHNKNGNSFFQDNKSILWCFFLILFIALHFIAMFCSLHNHCNNETVLICAK